MPEVNRPRATRAQAVIAGLFVLLGFGLALSVRSTAQSDGLSTARESDLIRILDDLTARNDRIATEQRDLQSTRDQLASGTAGTDAALQQARAQAQTLGILAGTLPATGSGVAVRITDPTHKVDAAALLDAIQELRDAGAEALSINSVRVVAATALVDQGGSIVVDGTTLQEPYQILAIGDPRTMSTALKIPGGVVESLHGVGADATVEERDTVDITALRVPTTLQYARPSGSAP